MTMIFNTAKEMAEHFITRETDERTWGTKVLWFTYTPEYRYWFNEVNDKYIRGKAYANEFLPEFIIEKQNVINNFADWITNNTDITFPTAWTATLTDAYERQMVYKVTYAKA